MSNCGKNGQKHFFSMQDVNFDDDAAIEEFARQVWQEVARQQTAGRPSIERDSSAGTTGEEKA